MNPLVTGLPSGIAYLTGNIRGFSIVNTIAIAIRIAHPCMAVYHLRKEIPVDFLWHIVNKWITITTYFHYNNIIASSRSSCERIDELRIYTLCT